MSRREREGILWILLAAAGFSITPTMVKLVYLHSRFEPMDIAIWRVILAVPIMWTMALLTRRPLGKRLGNSLPVGKLLCIGLIASAAILCAFYALERLPGSTYIVLLYSYPAMVALLSRLLGDEIHARTWLALALALLGVALTVPDLSAADGADMVGIGLALLNAFAIAIYYLLTRRALAGVENVSVASAVMMVGSLVALLALIPLRGLQFPGNPQTLLLLLGIAILGTVTPVFAINQALLRVGAAQASLVSTVEPIMAMFVAMLVLGEAVLSQQWLGAALIVGSVVALQLRPRTEST